MRARLQVSTKVRSAGGLASLLPMLLVIACARAPAPVAKTAPEKPRPVLVRNTLLSAAPPLPGIPFVPGVADPLVSPPQRAQIASCQGVDPGPALMRRLTRFEYNNTVRDILGDDSEPANDFPAEEKRHGFDNNSEALTVSPLLSEQYLLTAERLAAAYLDRNDDQALAKSFECNLDGDGHDACARTFIQQMGRRLFRHPLSDELRQAMLRVHERGCDLGRGADGDASGFRNGLLLTLTSMVQSTHFLYRVESGVAPDSGQAVVRLSPWETATRLSYLLWASAPDDVLLDAAEANHLGTRDEIAAQVTRMLKDKRAPAQVARFHEMWLELDAIDEAEKDPGLYPTFNKGIVHLMREETERFLNDVVWQGEGTLSAMLTAPYTFVDSSLALFYGMSPLNLPKGKEGNPRNEFMKVALDGKTRGGFITQGTFMAALAHANQTSPVRRGFWVRDRLLCETVPDPPPNAMIELPALDPKLTVRERFEEHAIGFGCSGCHDLMDPIGLGLENFDSIGHYREVENGLPVDASGEVEGLEGDSKFVGALGLARTLAGSPRVASCMTRRWFEYAYGRELRGSDQCSIDFVRERFAQDGGKILDVVRALTETDAFLYRRAPGTFGGSE